MPWFDSARDGDSVITLAKDLNLSTEAVSRGNGLCPGCDFLEELREFSFHILSVKAGLI